MKWNISILLLIHACSSPLAIYLGNASDEYLMDYSNTLMKLCLVILFLVPVVVESGVCQSSTNLQLKIKRRNCLLLGLSTPCWASVHHLLVRIPTVYLILLNLSIKCEESSESSIFLVLVELAEQYECIYMCIFVGICLYTHSFLILLKFKLLFSNRSQR